MGLKKWMNKKLRTMSKKSRDMVTVKPSGRIFRFGGGVTAKSLGLYTVPVSVAGKNTLLSVDIVEAPIPLLISKAAMKKAGAIIDTNDDTVTIFGNKEKMMTVKAGHYAIKLTDYVHDNKEVAEVLKEEEVDACETEDSENIKDAMVEILSVWAEDEEEKMKQIKKVHEQLGHPNIKIFRRMIKMSDGFNKDIDKCINKLYEDCIVCLKHGKSKVRPKVCTPISQEVNSTVAMDLKIWPKYG